MNDEEQLLQISCCLYFKIKCNNDIKDSFKFFYRELFLRLKYEFFYENYLFSLVLIRKTLAQVFFDDSISIVMMLTEIIEGV